MTPRSPLHVEVFHPLSVRPDEPGFHDLLGVLNDGVRAATDALGWTVHFTASGEVGADAALAAARRAEICVIRDAVARRAPLLGICRGLQLINVAFGGTLVQHLPTERLHRADGGDGGDPFVTTTFVPVPGADADGLDLSSPVRCTHHQAVGDLGAGLTVVARASDGVVEAVLHEDAPLTGVQWHPEHPEVAGAQLTALLRRMRGQLGPQGRGGQGVTRPGAVAS